MATNTEVLVEDENVRILLRKNSNATDYIAVERRDGTDMLGTSRWKQEVPFTELDPKTWGRGKDEERDPLRALVRALRAARAANTGLGNRIEELEKALANRAVLP